MEVQKSSGKRGVKREACLAQGLASKHRENPDQLISSFCAAFIQRG
jgi:hypothetical protein